VNWYIGILGILVSVSFERVCVDELVKYLRSKYSRAGCACLPAGRSVALQERANICGANIREQVVPACRQAGLWPCRSEQIFAPQIFASRLCLPAGRQVCGLARANKFLHNSIIPGLANH